MLQFSKLLLSFLCLQAMLYATDEKIPNSALQLIKKLSAWEEDLEKKFLEERNLKRKQLPECRLTFFDFGGPAGSHHHQA